ncbi:hybrid sensor histidine kinase/response regulator transcription factor [Saccharicrinis aurantiacus]|uniref:hybrid sensor histidine kinase/response regulator transcription factor n=1 Tax=Saccharicrinis aurantiacus TaxID=1849719 RepID=UPI00094F86B9|nr:hybrid sensor histidine kinase/response regulator transcription factor [Saccharicrinis aurantiacus]
MFKKSHLLIKCILIFLCLAIEPISASSTLNFNKQYSIADGLSDNGVTLVFQDSRSYVWIGTYNGLNRYNGYEFEVYKNTPHKKILAGRRIRSFCEDAKGNIWIGTEYGVSVYNYEKDFFFTLQTPKAYASKSLIVRSIVFDKLTDKIFCATEKSGILVYESDYSFSHRISFSDDLGYIICGKNSQSNIYYGGSKGLIEFDKASETCRLIETSSVGKIQDLVFLNDSNLLLASSNGIIHLQNEKKSGEWLVHNQFEKDYCFTSILKGANNSFWLGTLRSGLLFVDDVSSILKDQTLLKQQLSKGISRVSSIIKLSNNSIWVGSFDMGVFQYSYQPNIYKYINSSNENFRVDRIQHITQSDSSSIYLASNSKLIKYNKQNNEFESSDINFYKWLKKQISKVFIDSNNRKWVCVGTQYLYLVDATGEVLFNLTAQFPSLNSIKAISEDDKGQIWLATESDVFRIVVGESVDVLSLKEAGVFKEKSFNHINNIYVDPLYPDLWLTTYYEGLVRITNIDKDEFAFEQFVNIPNDSLSIPSNFVTSIVRLPNKQLWIGTEGGGLCELKTNNNKTSFKAFTERDGLSNNIVRSILTKHNTLWVATNNGLNILNTDNAAITKLNTDDGLPFNSFRLGAAKLQDGTMFFSGYKGFFYFNPDDINTKKDIPNLEFGALKLNNRIIHPGDTVANRVLLDKRLNELDKIELNYNENVFSIEAIPLHLSAPNSHYLQYRLLPLNKKWIEERTSQRYINFNGLPHGDYTLEVRVSNINKEWSEAKTLHIRIKAPWWELMWVRLLVVFIIVLGIYIAVKTRFKLIQLNHKVELEQLEKKNVEDLNNAKLRFFSNISHEIKTPLTLISGPVGVLLDRFKAQPNIKDKLDMIQRQSIKIAQLVDQVHDFQRSNANQLELQKSHFKFDEFIKQLVSQFEFVATTDNKKLVLKGPSNVYVWADENKLEKVINNLLNNALKFTDSGDTIVFEFELSNSDLLFKVTDTGCGIDPDALPFIFDRFYQAGKAGKSYAGGSGIGLAFAKMLVEMHYGSISASSVLSEGTCITVRLPIVENEDIDLIKKMENEVLSTEKSSVTYSFLSGDTEDENIQVNSDFADALIFFAEDNTELRRFVVDTLGQFYNIKAFEDGQRLLEAMNHQWPDIIISDLMMPNLNGFELCKNVKAEIKTNHIPFILLTASSSLNDQIKGLEKGADLYIKKPFNMQYLVTSIDALLKSRVQLRERFQMEVPLKLDRGDKQSENNSFLTKLYELLDENLSNTELELDSLASALFLNRTFFYQKVKALTNQTPYELLKSYRIKKAAFLMINERLSVQETFEQTGFKSRAHFNKMFKDTYGVSPSQYMKNKLSEE